MIDLKDKNILVTGSGGTGVGSGICEVLNHFGVRLILNEIEEESLSKLQEKYPGSYVIQADISREEDVEAMFAEIEEKVGKLDGLVNNAGIGLIKNAHEATSAEFDKLFNVDIKGLWQVSRAFVNHLLKHNHTGNVVNISSIHALRTMGKYAIYASAKSAVEGLTRGMAIELGEHHIRVNSVGPGYVHSGQNKVLLKALTDDPERWIDEHINRFQAIHEVVQPANCGNVVAFLLSQQSNGVTGQSLYVDNGTTIMLYNE